MLISPGAGREFLCGNSNVGRVEDPIFLPVAVILMVTPGPDTIYIIARGLHEGC